MGERNLSTHGDSQGFRTNQEVHSINSINHMALPPPSGKTLMNNTMQNFSLKPNLTSVSTKDKSAFGKRGSAMTPILENAQAPGRNGKGVLLNTSSAHEDIKMPSIAGS